MKTVLFLIVLLGVALCGDCSMYATKEACWASCACCWGGSGGYYTTYQCQWKCNSGDSNYANPSTYCNVVNTAASLAIVAGIIFGLLAAGALFLCGLAAILVGLMWTCDQIRDRVKRYVGRQFVIGVVIVAALAAVSSVAAVAYPVAGVLLASAEKK